MVVVSRDSRSEKGERRKKADDRRVESRRWGRRSGGSRCSRSAPKLNGRMWSWDASGRESFTNGFFTVAVPRFFNPTFSATLDFSAGVNPVPHTPGDTSTFCKQPSGFLSLPDLRRVWAGLSLSPVRPHRISTPSSKIHPPYHHHHSSSPSSSAFLLPVNLSTALLIHSTIANIVIGLPICLIRMPRASHTVLTTSFFSI